MLERERRRDQPALESLNHFSRFVNHFCAEKGITQASIARDLGGPSSSTVSRLFRGQAEPTAKEIDRLAPCLGVPVANLRALRFVDAVSGGAMLDIVPACRGLLEGSGTRFLIGGMTLVNGSADLRGVQDTPERLIMVSIADPDVPGSQTSPLRELEQETDGRESGRDHIAWLSTVGNLRAFSRKSPVRLWVRPTARIGVGPNHEAIDQIVANDWIAVVSAGVPRGSSFVVLFFNEPEWNRIVKPLSELMEGPAIEGPHGEQLIWDSRWSSEDERQGRLRQRVEAAMRAISPANFLGR